MSRDTNPSSPALAGEAARGEGSFALKSLNAKPEFDIAEAARRYAAGETLIQIGAEYGLGHSALGHRLRKAGVTLRCRGCRPNPAPRPVAFNVDEAIRLYNMGGSTHTIGRRLGVSWMTVRDHLVKAGVAMRPKGQPRPERVGYTAYVAAHTDEASARREGRAAADRAEPITACPSGRPLWFSAAWRNGWVERREELRAKRQREWEREQNRLPPGGRRASQVGQRMSRATARARLGEAYA